jgi:hypothetical protein
MVFSNGCRPSRADGLSTGEEQRAERDWQANRAPPIRAETTSPVKEYVADREDSHY